jgi:uncharacterized RDD family membrane protein YckC
VTRVIAAGVDGVIVAALVGAAWAGWCALAFVWHPRAFEPPSPPPALAGTAYSLAAIAYLTSAWALSGRTTGYQLMGLRAVSRAGGQLGWSQSAGRAAMCVILPIGLLWIAVSPGRRALHDIAWRSYVVYDWTPHQAAVSAFAGGDGDADADARRTREPVSGASRAVPARLVHERSEGAAANGRAAVQPHRGPDVHHIPD